MIMPAPRLEVQNVSKSFPGVRALKGVNLRVYPGEVLALIGENGAGKSTLMKILAGIQTPDAGQILMDGQPVVIDSVQAAGRHGVSLIHQELNLCDNLNVAGNVFLGRELRRFGFLRQREMARLAKDRLDAVGLDVSPWTIVRDLPIGKQQMIEIAKALSANARVLIMDEPTSSLSQYETEALFRVVKDLRRQGVSIVYISHRLGEVKELADRVAVFRDGENAGELRREEIDHDRMVRMMVGRDLSQFYIREPHPPGPIVLEVDGLVTSAHPRHPLHFSLRSGEIVGVAGLVGAGRTEMLRVLFGVDPMLGGAIRVQGQTARITSPSDAIEQGLALVPEDRKQQGLVLEMGVRANVGLAGLHRHRQAGAILDRRREKTDAEQAIRDLNIKTPSARQIVQLLSGGNQQKVVLGKWLALSPRILLLDEPTRGIDVGAKREIYQLMDRLAKAGMAILFVSSEMEEVLGMSDRALVMHEGRLAGELTRSQLSEEAIMRLATGGT